MDTQPAGSQRIHMSGADMSVCILVGALFGYILSIVTFIIFLEKRESLSFRGQQGRVTLSAEGLRLYGNDYSQATLFFGQGTEGDTPVLEIRDKDAVVRFRSTPDPAAEKPDTN